MPIYNEKQFVERIYKDKELLRRVYQRDDGSYSDEKSPATKGDEGLVYSLYDINYNAGPEGEVEIKSKSGDLDYIREEVWGKSNELPVATYNDTYEEEGYAQSQEIVYDSWSTGLSKQAYVDPGFVDYNEIQETDKDNYKDYNLYIDLYRTNPYWVKTNAPIVGYGEGSTPDEARENALSDLYLSGAAGESDFVISSYNYEVVE